MTGHLLTLFQGAAEYGALTGSGAGTVRGQPIIAWASDHAVLLLVVGAGVLLLGMLATTRRS